MMQEVSENFEVSLMNAPSVWRKRVIFSVSADGLWWIFRKFYSPLKCNSLLNSESMNWIEEKYCMFVMQLKSLQQQRKKWLKNSQHFKMTAENTKLLHDIKCLGLVNFRMWHPHLSTPLSWNTSSLASSRFFRMERCSFFKKNLHRCVSKGNGLWSIH